MDEQVQHRRLAAISISLHSKSPGAERCPTLGIYAKAVTRSKRRAHERIVEGLLGATKDKPIAVLKGEGLTLVG
jgi:hypothetical protein